MRIVPELQRLGDSPRPLEVCRVEVGGKAEWRAVRDRDCFFLGLEAEKRRNGSKSF